MESDKPPDQEEKTAQSKAARNIAAQADKAANVSARLLPNERAKFRALLISNPNYFGNLKVSPFKPVLTIKADPTYEEICSVGFQPQFDRLEAVIFVNQPSGYGGNICSPGTPEYVRFFISTDNGATWDDLGLTSFIAYDIPEGTQGRKRLEYAVTLRIDPHKRWCLSENLAQVRAILSWNDEPTAGDSDFIPVWGDVHNTHIQIDKRDDFSILDILKDLNIELIPDIDKALDLSGPIKAAVPKALSLTELHEAYKGKGVEPHRFALTELRKFIDQPTLSKLLVEPGGKGFLAELGIDPAQIADLLNPKDGSTRYEQLDCIGLDRNLDTLVGVIRVKEPYGFNGGLCTDGSREYVTFWADFDNNGTFETCLGTTSVNVYDIESIPKEDLEYAVFLPVDFSRYRRPCEEGPVIIPIRAILSWQVPPPCWNPEFPPVWGNRLDTLVQIRPGRPNQPGEHIPIIQTVGSMDVDDISPFTGLANGPALLAGFTALDSPFGGKVIITGHIADPPDISSGALRLKYRVEVSNDNWITFQKLTNPFTLPVDQLLNGIWSDLPDINQMVDGDDFYQYQEDLTDGLGNAMFFPVGNVLAVWKTGGFSDGVWKLRIRVKDPAVIGPEWFSDDVTVKLDNTAPDAAITITSGSGPCGDFLIGDVISGTYSATDLHFDSLTLVVAPALGGSFTSPAPLPAGPTMPLTRTYPGVPTVGEGGGWSLDTTGMPRCGYTIHLHVSDRTIRESGFIGYTGHDVVGLCLRESA